MSQRMNLFGRKTAAVFGLIAVAALAVPALADPQSYPDQEGTVPRFERRQPPDGEAGMRPAPPSQAEREKWNAMTPEAREAAHQARRAAFLEKLTPEQRQQHEAHEKEHQARRAEFEKLSPEERKAKFGERGPRPQGEGARQGQGAPRGEGTQGSSRNGQSSRQR